MKKLASFIVDKRYIILAVMLVLTVVAAVLFPRVGLNTDMTKYLANDSSMRKGMRIMEKEFPATSGGQNIRVMFTGLTEEQKEDVSAALRAIEHVDGVRHDDSPTYNKDEYTLYILDMSCAYGSKEEKAITTALKSTFDGYDMCYRSSDVTAPEIPVWVIAGAMLILIAVLLAMSGSWFEPVLFLATIGLAIVLNLGSNIVLGSISDVTFSVAAILQLILSLDYSIILTNRYRQERKRTDDKTVAMKNALSMSFGSVSGSALTTVVGLLMLLFMRFKIGMDMGLVLAKGVLLSLVCVFTVLPCLLIMSDKLLRKTEKRRRKKPLAAFAPSAAPAPAPSGDSPVTAAVTTDTATPDTAVSATAQTVQRRPRSLSGAMATFSFKARYVLLGIFVALFAAVCFLQTKTPVRYTIGEKDAIQKVFASENPIVIVYRNEDEQAVHAFAQTLLQEKVVEGVAGYSDTVGTPYTADEAVFVLGGMGVTVDGALLHGVYDDYFAGRENDGHIPLCDLVNYLCADVMDTPAYAGAFDEQQKAVLRAVNTQLSNGAAQLKGATYSRLTLTTHLPEESKETAALFDRITKTLDDTLRYGYYLVGSSAMNYEMAHSFDTELLLITLLTIAAIFAVVAVSFRNLLIPALLVLLVQCGVYITVTVLHFAGVYYLALLIVECILMGATIDYGILFANYYRENRAFVAPREAVKRAYEGTVRTVFTSGLGMFLVTGIIGVLASGIISQMCFAVAIGTLSAVVMILLVLPALLMLFDKPVMHKIGRKKEKKNDAFWSQKA